MAMNGVDADVLLLPSVLHFFQLYGVGDGAFFARTKLPHDFFSCGSHLMEEPAPYIAVGGYLYRRPTFFDARKEYSAVVEKREAFVICAMTGFLNEAASFYKMRHCGYDANTRKEINLHDLPEGNHK